VDNLIENIAYKSTDGNVINENFDPTLLESKFRQAMSILQVNKGTYFFFNRITFICHLGLSSSN
jgi:hypothetical protein